MVTFTNEAADPGPLEICKAAGTPAPVGTSFSFTVSGTTGTTTVPVGGCAIVGGSLDPTLFPFNSTQTVTELASSGNATSAISVSPTYVTEVVGTSRRSRASSWQGPRPELAPPRTSRRRLPS